MQLKNFPLEIHTAAIGKYFNEFHSFQSIRNPLKFIISALTMNALQIQNLPKGYLETSSAPPIRNGNRIISKGARTTRIGFDQLPDDEYRIAGTLSNFCHFYKVPFHIEINGKCQRVWLNLQSLIKRFHLPESVILRASQQSDLQRIIDLAKDKIAFQPPVNGAAEGNEMVPMLSRDKDQMAPLDEIVRQAREQNRDIKLSRRVYNIPRSVLITQGGFVAFNEPKFIGKGGYSVIKKSATRTGLAIVRRTCKNPGNRERIFQNLELFRGKKGVIDTLATSVYVNKMGKTKAVSYHPAYQKDMYYLIRDNDPLSEQDTFDITHHLLLGLVEVAKRGMHGDLTADNVLTRRENSRMEAVISDLDTFSGKGEAKGMIISSTWAAPETIQGRKIKDKIPPDERRDVWPVGVMLYHIFQQPANKRIEALPWLRFDKWSLKRNAASYQTQEKIDGYVTARHFSPRVEQLLKGILRVDPKERWTAKQALEFFEQNFQRIGSILPLSDTENPK